MSLSRSVIFLWGGGGRRALKLFHDIIGFNFYNHSKIISDSKTIWHVLFYKM